MSRAKMATLFGVMSLSIMIGFQNCSKTSFSSNSSASDGADSAAGSGSGSGNGNGNGNTGTNTNTGGNPSNNPPTGGTTVTIQSFKPALAVRDISCLACHANIQANVITDFGYNDSWYLNGFNNPTSMGQTHYTATPWATLDQVVGQIIVPTVVLPVSFVQAQQVSGSTPPANTVDLVSYLTRTDLQSFDEGWHSYFGEPAPSTNVLTNSVQPATSGTATVAAKSLVFIGAPTAAQILSIVTAPSSTAPWVQAKGSTSAGVTGLSVVMGVNGKSYVTNSGAVSCSNQDVVINGTLLINNGQFYAENGGCRLYVTGSVFIEGPITYLNSGATADATDNLQISSATSIVMGVGLNGQALNGDGSNDTSDSPLKVRLLDDIRNNLVLRAAPSGSTYSTYANAILAEGTNIGVTLLQDASVPGSATTAKSGAKQSRTSINFQHILLNAPLIHSRYMGTVSGVVVAESAMFSLGEFHFNYDGVFDNVSILPALGKDIVCTGTPCNSTY